MKDKTHRNRKASFNFKYIVIIFVTGSILLAAVSTAKSQQFTGIIKDSISNLPIGNANILLKNSQNKIVAFAISNENGKYSIQLKDSSVEKYLDVEVRSIGYQPFRKKINNSITIYDFYLSRTIHELRPVQVESNALIKKKGDTLSYDVSSFAMSQDRSIGDVIARMPGLSVDDKGQIFFNGKSVSNFYIHGDDLMDGSYGLATKAITKEMIKSIDIMQNFQPVKVLKNRVFTENVAINLVLKNENSLNLTGQAMIGAGIPGLYDVTLTGMLFNKKVKMLNSLKANNSGIDYRDEFHQFGLSYYQSAMDIQKPDRILSTAMIGTPDVPKLNYYQNESGVFNLNNLYNTRDSIQIKCNIQGFADKNSFRYLSKTTRFLSTDTIQFNEEQQLNKQQQLLNVTLTLESNKYSGYLFNRVSARFNEHDDYGYLNFNGVSFNQQLKVKISDIANDLNWMPVLKNKNVFGIRWYINYQDIPEHLQVETGLNSNILNNSKPYTSVAQSTNTPSYFSHLYASYNIMRNSSIKQSYEFGILNEKQTLNSLLELTQTDGSVACYTGDSGNHLEWHRDKVYSSGNYTIRKDRWQLSLFIPVIWQKINYGDTGYSLNQINNRIFVNPVASAKLYLNAEDYLVANYAFRSSTGNIAGLHHGLILNNFRSLVASDAELQENTLSGSGISYYYRRSIIMLFINAALRYEKIISSSILSTITTNNMERLITIPYENSQNSILATVGVNKYLASIRTKLSFVGTWRKSSYDQYFNSQKLPFLNDAFSANVGIDGKLRNGFSLTYGGIVSWNSSKQSGLSTSSIFTGRNKRLDQRLNLGYTFLNYLVSASARYISTEGLNAPLVHSAFADIKARVKLRKPNSDIDIDITNIFNTQEYTINNLASNQTTQSQYTLRGRMIMFRFTFNF